MSNEIKCPKCGSKDIRVELGLGGQGTCKNCEWSGPNAECFIKQEYDELTVVCSISCNEELMSFLFSILVLCPLHEHE